MRDRTFRAAALVLGVLGIPSLAFQLFRTWPPSWFQLQFYGMQALVLWIFLMYGLGRAFYAPTGASRKPADDPMQW